MNPSQSLCIFLRLEPRGEALCVSGQADLNNFSFVFELIQRAATVALQHSEAETANLGA